MPMSIESPRLFAASRHHMQYTLQAGLGTMTVSCLLIAYLRPLGVLAVGRCGLVVLMGAVLGCIVGAMTRRPGDTLFWSVMGAVAGYLAVLSAFVYHWTGTHVWPIVGALSGAAAVVPPPTRPFLRMFAAGATAAALILAYQLALFGSEPKSAAELLCAALGGAMLGLASEIAGWFEARISVSRSAIAIGVVRALIAGHWLAVHFIPGW